MHVWRVVGTLIKLGGDTSRYILCLLSRPDKGDGESKASLPPKLGGSRDATTFGHPSSNGIPPSNEIVGVVDWLLKRGLKRDAGDQRPYRR